MTRQPVAYIRRSVATRTDPGDVSREFQTDKVRALANGDGARLRIEAGDWGRSAAGEKTDKRLSFLAILEDIERGQVSTLYAYSADRLARSVQWSARLLDACETAGTTIVTSEGRFAPGDDMARQMFHFQAMQNEGALRQMTRKAKATAGVRASRGDHVGRAPYGFHHEMRDRVSVLVPCPAEPHERLGVDGMTSCPGEDPGHVVAAFAATGSYLQAARSLNAEHWPTRFGKAWDPTTVRHVVQRARPDLIPFRPRRGAKTRASRVLSGLLRCHCGRTLTSSPTKTGVRYWCAAGHSDPTHPRPYTVNEAKLLPWLRDEVARLRTPDALEMASDTTRAADLEAKRARIVEAFIDGLIDKAERDRRLAAIGEAMDGIEAASALVAVPAIDWTWPPETLNAVLRAMFRTIELGPDLLPVRAEWTVPEWRA